VASCFDRRPSSNDIFKTKLVSTELSLLGIIKRPEGELNVVKKAYIETSSEKTLLEEQCERFKRDAEQQKEYFEQKLRVRYSLKILLSSCWLTYC